MAEGKGGFVGETIRKKTEAGEKLLETYKELAKNPYVKVGVLEGKAEQEKKTRKSKKTEGAETEKKKPTLVEVATWMEFGTKLVPQRSFLRGAIIQFRSELNKTTIQVHRQITRGKLTVDQGLRILGEAIQAKVQKRIRDGIGPELKRATIVRKGSSTPLIDTGQLVNSIRYKVEEEGGGEEGGV